MARSIPNSASNPGARLEECRPAMIEGARLLRGARAEPSASAEQLRAAFREAVLRHIPTRPVVGGRDAPHDDLLNRAGRSRDPVRRLHYDRALEAGRAPPRVAARARAAAPAAAVRAAAHASRAEPVAPAAVALGVGLPRARGRLLAGRPRRSAGSSSTTSPGRTGATTRSATGWLRGAPLRRARPDRGLARRARASARAGPPSPRSSTSACARPTSPARSCAARWSSPASASAIRRLAAAALGRSRAARPARRVPRPARQARAAAQRAENAELL